MKKTLSALLCLVFVIGLMPTTAFAVEIIEKVQIVSIEPPVAGQTWDGSAAVYSNSNYSVVGIAEWYDETDKHYMVNNETFKIGHTYTVYVTLEAKDGYEFNSTATGYYMKGYIDENEAKLSKVFEYQRWARVVVSYTFPKMEEKKKITRILVDDIIEPKIGRQSISRAHYLKYSEGVMGYDVAWHVEHNYIEDFTGVFAEKTGYTLTVVMKPQEGYEFARNPDKTFDILVTFNGETVTNLMSDGQGGLVARKYYEHLGEAKPKISGAITYKVAEPVIGEKPSYDAENQRDDRLYVLDGNYPGTTKNGITWYEGLGDDERVMGENDTFKPGTYYRVSIRVKPIAGYLFETDKNDDFILVGVINQRTAICAGTDETAFVGYTFQTPEKKEERTIISEVEAVSNYSDIACVGGKASAPQFTVVKGAPAKIKFTGYQIENEKGEFVDLPLGSVFTDAPIKILGQLIIEGDANKDYLLHKDVKLTVNGIEWFMGNVGFYDDHSACWVVSMKINPSPKKEEEKPTETPTETPAETPTEKPSETPKDNKVSFADVTSSVYYYEPVMWAAEKGITGGTGNGMFSPNNVCTRGQVVTFLWRAAGSPEPKSSTNPFTDVKNSDYFYKAVLWAVENNITGGTGNGKFSPNDDCTRGQVVTFLHRTAKSPEPKSVTNSFTDVATSDYFYKAVLWAAESNITGGTGNGKFSPNVNCTRAQVVTFLYRFMK